MAIIDDCRDLTEQISYCLSKNELFEVVGVAHTGTAGLELLIDTPVDVALIDIVMPWKDGLFILENLNAQCVKKPVCIMLTAMNKEPLTKRALELGAEYFMLKPFDSELLIQRILGIMEYKGLHSVEPAPVISAQKHNPENFAALLLQNCGIQTKFKGYQYLKMAIELSIKDSKMLGSFTKSLYPTIAKAYCVTPISIEKSMRNAINFAMKNSPQSFCDALSLSHDSKVRITSSAFISMAVEKYKLQS